MKKYTDLDSVLDDMPLFLNFENAVRGPMAANARKRADLNGEFVFFQKNGKRCYKSNCPHYGGYWLDGLQGAVVCKQIDFLLPGLILELYCREHCDDCPLHNAENEEKT